MNFNNNLHAFFALVRAGLWEEDVRLSKFGEIDYSVIYRLAEEQSVVGLVAAGLEHVVDVNIPKEDVFTFVGSVLQIEQRNQAMNRFIEDLVGKMRDVDIYALLVKGQGVAQCYERPLWRACGDVDFLLSETNYKKAVNFLTPMANSIDDEILENNHLSMKIGSWIVELHGSLRGLLWNSMDQVIDEAKNTVFCDGAVRSWIDGRTLVFLPKENEDTVFLFTHILQHFFKEGVGLRQVCDWCRLLWTYRYKIDKRILKNRIKSMKCDSEWNAFAYLAVNTLGMPESAMPFYKSDSRWKYKADKTLSFIIETGSFGHNRNYDYYGKYPYLIYKIISFWRHSKDECRYLTIFPLDSIKVWINKIKLGISYIFRGK